MDFDHLSDTLPTILITSQSSRKIPYPSQTLIKAVIFRIQSRKDLHTALLSLWPDSRNQQSDCQYQLAAIISKGLIDIEEMRIAFLERERAEDLSAKTKSRWANRVIKARKRANQIKKFGKVVHREIMAKHAVALISEKPARHGRDPYRRCVVRLYDLFSWHTPTPYKFVAALTGLFNLHPRQFCTTCGHFPKPRKSAHTRKIQSLTERVRRGFDLCTLGSIFDCPKRYRSTLK